MIRTTVKLALKLSTLFFFFALPIIGQENLPKMDAPLPKFEIVSNKANPKAKVRNIFVYLGKEEFNLSSVSQVIQKIGNEFCDPYILYIAVFSNREMIDWQLKGIELGFKDFARTPETQKAEAEYYAKIFPPPTGYLRAVYGRNPGFEYINISPSADSDRYDLYLPVDQNPKVMGVGFAPLKKSACRLK